ncbi:collagen alpha-1(III) chain-like [Lagenorhynchus albirostris]|uniref:collagen alpha-1(III) chain-like n=1 Tax=Lagenorhynchus albirostris TaxID=27610 RepID=UPI0028EA168A|nr:collagen alpha-1(III) chain-like [Lagenorhynchus albirostris]
MKATPGPGQTLEGGGGGQQACSGRGRGKGERSLDASGESYPPNRPTQRRPHRARIHSGAGGGSRQRGAETPRIYPELLPRARDLPPRSRRPAALPPRPPLETRPNNTCGAEPRARRGRVGREGDRRGGPEPSPANLGTSRRRREGASAAPSTHGGAPPPPRPTPTPPPRPPPPAPAPGGPERPPPPAAASPGPRGRARTPAARGPPAKAPGTSAEPPAARGPDALAATAAAPRGACPGSVGGSGGRPHPSPPPGASASASASGGCAAPGHPHCRRPWAGDSAGTSLTRFWLRLRGTNLPAPDPPPPSATRATPLGPVPALALVSRRRLRPRRRGPARQAPPPTPSLAAGEGGPGASGTPIGCVRLPSGPPSRGWSDALSFRRRPHPRTSISPLPRPHSGPARQGRAADCRARRTRLGSAPGGRELSGPGGPRA